MKRKLTLALTGLLLTLSVLSANATASNPIFGKKNEKVASMTDDQKAVRIEEIRSRVDEIKAMDKSTLSSSERRALKKELKQMNKESKEMRGGVYLSVGAIIIIILLLILIL